MNIYSFNPFSSRIFKRVFPLIHSQKEAGDPKIQQCHFYESTLETYVHKEQWINVFFLQERKNGNSLNKNSQLIQHMLNKPYHICNTGYCATAKIISINTESTPRLIVQCGGQFEECQVLYYITNVKNNQWQEDNLKQ